MNTKEIEELVRRYQEGKTSAGEEKILKDHFLSGEVPPGLAEFKAIFRFYESSSKEMIHDEEFDVRFFSALEKPETPVVRMETKRNRRFYSLAVAASFLLLAGLIFVFLTGKNDFSKKDRISVEDQMLVYNQAHDVLALVSVNFNKGLEKMTYLGKFDAAVQKMEMLSKYYQYQSIIINPGQLDGSDKTK